MRPKKDFFGINEVATLFKVDPSTVRYWCSRGLLYYDRLDSASRRRVYPETLVSFVRDRGTPVESLDQDMWRRVLSASENNSPVVDYPRVLVVDLEGIVKTASRGIGYLLGYEEVELVGSSIDMKMSFKDLDIGAPLLFRRLDRLAQEPSRAEWGSYNSDRTGYAWITPIRAGEDSVSGWVLSLD